MMADITELAECFNHADSPLHSFFEGCIMDICAGGDPLEVFCDTLDALVELCEELLETAISAGYRQETGCGKKRSICEFLILYMVVYH